ncbi:hypothetical protein Avbf_17366 [Armadillidium vulgare]|nr:hypothetical protein Avbf_17366 [Armadillidium vulgare]
MSYWNTPLSLQHLSCKGLAIRCVSSFKSYAELKIDLYSCGATTEEETATLLRNRILELEKFFITIPGTRGKLGTSLEFALENATELEPDKQCDLTDYVFYLLLKVFLLESVFIDRDYPNNFGLCLIPCAYESLIRSVLKGHTFKVKKLFIYGATYPSILETIISQAKDLKQLAVSQINLTDNLMNCIRFCPELEELYLLHSYIWMAVSSSALCRGFFDNFPEEIVSQKYENEEEMTLSFPQIKKC